MAPTKHVLKLSAIVDFFSDADEKRLIARGENAVESNHIKSFHFIPELLLIRGEVCASMRDRIYNVEVNLFKDGAIKDASCTCPRGQYLCHHVAALCIFGHHNISVTDIECRWAAKKSKEEDVKTIDEIYMAKSHVSCDTKLTEAEVTNFCTTLQQYGTSVGFTWLLAPEPTVVLDLIPDVEDFIFSEAYFAADDKQKCFLERMKISPEKIKKICTMTVGQSRNENWLICRKNRLTGSNFGAVLAAISRKKYSPSLYKRLTGFYSVENIKAVQWGNINEGQAIKEFTEETKLQVVPTGLWLSECGFLGSSPDGLVGDNAIIEIKCPYKFREKLMSEELRTHHLYIVYFNGDELMLNKKHEYYHQIQGNLTICDRELCYLFIWTPRENILLEVCRDKDWIVNLKLLENFYLQEYLSYLICNAFNDV